MTDGRNNNVKNQKLVVQQPSYRRAWYYRPGVGVRSEYHRWWFVEIKETAIAGESTCSQETEKQKSEEMKVKFAWSAIVMLLAALIAVAYCIYLLWKLITLIRNEEENQIKAPREVNDAPAPVQEQRNQVVGGPKSDPATEPVKVI